MALLVFSSIFSDSYALPNARLLAWWEFTQKSRDWGYERIHG